MSFLGQMGNQSDGTIVIISMAARKVKNVQPIGRSKSEITTYASKPDKTSLLDDLLATINVDTLMYLVNFENNQGYAIISADKCYNNIYAIIDEGSLDVDTLI